MPPITRCHSTTGRTAASRKPAAPTRRALRRARLALSARSDATRRLWSLEDLRQRRGHPLDLALGHLREERQRDRPRGDALAHRELALPVPEGLPVIAHEVDRGQVGLALHPAYPQSADLPVAIGAARQLHERSEPPPPRPALVVA